jgi:hypothetical protein
LNVAVAAVVLLPLVPTLPAPTTNLTTPIAFASTAPATIAPGATVLFEPLPSSDYPRAMQWQVSSRFTFAMIGGYIAGSYAPGVDTLQERIHSIEAAQPADLSENDRFDIFQRLLALGVNDVVVGSGASPGTVSLFMQVFRAPPAEFSGFLVWQVAVYHA